MAFSVSKILLSVLKTYVACCCHAPPKIPQLNYGSWWLVASSNRIMPNLSKMCFHHCNNHQSQNAQNSHHECHCHVYSLMHRYLLQGSLNTLCVSCLCGMWKMISHDFFLQLGKGQVTFFPSRVCHFKWSHKRCRLGDVCSHPATSQIMASIWAGLLQLALFGWACFLRMCKLHAHFYYWVFRIVCGWRKVSNDSSCLANLC